MTPPTTGLQTNKVLPQHMYDRFNCFCRAH